MLIIFNTVIAFAQALFFGVAGILALVRARGAGRARGLVMTAGALACLYALWSAAMQVLWMSVPPVPATVPGVDAPELTPMEAFMENVLQPAWRYGSWLLICAIALLLVIALARSGAAAARTPRHHGHQGPTGPPGPHGQLGPHGQQPPHPGQQPAWDQPYGAQYQQAHHQAQGYSGPQHPPMPYGHSGPQQPPGPQGPPAPPPATPPQGSAAPPLHWAPQAPPSDHRPPAPPEQLAHQQPPLEGQWAPDPALGQPPQEPPRRRPGRHRAPDSSEHPDPPGHPEGR